MMCKWYDRIDEGQERLLRSTGSDPVIRIFLAVQVRKSHYFHACRNPDQAIGDVLRVAFAGIIVVRQDHDIPIGKVGREGRMPLAGAAGVAGCRETK